MLPCNSWCLVCAQTALLFVVRTNGRDTAAHESASFRNWFLRVALNIWNFLLKTLTEQGEKDYGESIQINFRDEVFVFTLSNSHFE